MAGKRQHYIPRLLQRGFLHDSPDEAERTWLHRRDVEARLVGIRDIGVEDWFYSRRSADGSPTLDDQITDIERIVGPIVGRLRASAPGASIDPVEAAQTVVHLVMRTAHLRKIISVGMTNLTFEIGSIFTNPERLAEMIGLTGSAPASAVLEAIRDSASELAAEGVPIAFAERAFAFLLREFGEWLITQSIEMLGPLFPQLLSELVGKVRSAHNSVLAASPDNNGWLIALTAFEWTIEVGTDLILSDAVALAREDSGPFRPFLLAKAVDSRAMVMPVSSDRLLVGRAVGSGPIELDDFNAQAAANCESFFIGAKPSNSRLNALIGSAPNKAIEDAVFAAVRGAEQVRSMNVGVITPAEFHEKQEFSYSVRLADFGDEILVKEFANVLNGAVGVLSRNIPLHELDGFTLALDYDNALAMLDLGSTDLPPAKSRASGYCLGVAQLVSVIREGVQKKHLVISAEIAEKWLSSDAAVRASGLYTLVKMLGELAYSTLYTSARGAVFTPDAMKREFHPTVASVPASYWSARQSAFMEPDHGQIYADLVIDSCEFAERKIEKERAYISDAGDINGVMMVALECVSATLNHTANWLGHRDGLAESHIFKGNDLSERLKARGLDRWVDLFGRDLAACFGEDRVLNSEIAINLSSHVERLLWSFGISCWPQGNEVFCLVTDRSFRPPRLL